MPDKTPQPGSVDAPERRDAVRRRYGRIAANESTDGDCCTSPTDDAGASTCCGSTRSLTDHSRRLGYADDDVDRVAAGANLGLGCGNPNAIASLAPGETVLDLGAGAGFDCFLAAREVGPSGAVIGVDMTPEMVERARANIEKNDLDNVEFRLGEIEHLPVADASVDVVISNCVINLAADKPRVFREAFRVLRPGGRLAISDVVMTAPMPPEVRDDPEAVAACIAGAASVPELESAIAAAGFESFGVRPVAERTDVISEWSTDVPLERYVVSAEITGRKLR